MFTKCNVNRYRSTNRGRGENKGSSRIVRRETASDKHVAMCKVNFVESIREQLKISIIDTH